jgi:DNA-binding phage protein
MTRSHRLDAQSVLELCDQRLWTIRRLAREAGIDNTGLYRALDGLSQPTDRTIRLVARALNVSVEAITVGDTASKVAA